MALNMSILDAVLKRRITPAQGLALAEMWVGGELKQIPGGQALEALLGDFAAAGANAADAPVVAVAKAIEAPVDAFLAAGLGAGAGQAAADVDAAVDAQANALIAFIQLQVANLKQNLALGFAEG